LLLEAGTVGGKLELHEQRRIRAILLTHAHFDHVQGLPTMADNLIGNPPTSVRVVALRQTLRSLTEHIFNNSIYPDFFSLPDPAIPVFLAEPFETNNQLEVEGLQVVGIPVNHTVPAVGYLISDATTTLLYSGDTHDTDELWLRAASIPTLKAAFIETSYPDSLSDLAKKSKHLTPSLLVQQLRKLGRPDVPVYVYHVKPRYREQIRTEVERLGLHQQVMFIEEDHVFHLA
jgi:cAMP phosphodiesterase